MARSPARSASARRCRAGCAREGLTWTVNDAYAAGDGTISITVDVAWDGAKYADVLTLAEVDGRWRITAKASHRQARTEARFGGY